MKQNDLMALQWRKSSYSNGTRTCVEVAPVARAVAARDSKDPEAGVLLFGEGAWSSFLHRIRAGRFDR